MKKQNSAQEARRRRLRRQMGMTLIEIMVVVVILGLIGTVVGVSLIRKFDESKVQVARTQVCKLRDVVNGYRIKKGTYPSGSDGLQSLVTAREIKKIPTDPWGMQYQYQFPSTSGGDGFELYSFGADRKEGGSDLGKDIHCEKD